MPLENPLRDDLGRRFGLIETLRWEPGTGAIRATRHLDRMQGSAMHFGKMFDRDEAADLLLSVSSEERLRLRLLLDGNDHLTLAQHPFQPLPDDAVWTVKIAKTRLASTDPLLAHKTTERQAYENARAEFALAEANEVLMENEEGLLCEGTITSIFVEKNGTLVTPRLSHGLLRGILRQEMIDEGRAVEGEITRADLKTLPFFVGNSLRGLIQARLA